MPFYGELKTTAATQASQQPYGTTTLEATDLGQLQQSLLRQIDKAGLPQPDEMDVQPQPHPAAELLKKIDPLGITTNSNPLFIRIRAQLLEALILDAAGYATNHVIHGFASPDLLEYERQEKFQNSFPDQPSCELFPITAKSFGAFVALHETTHYIARNLGKNGPLKGDTPNLSDEVLGRVMSNAFSSSNMDKSQPIQALIKDTTLVSQNLEKQIPERIADVGAALYTLSNYSDNESAISFYKNISDFRKIGSDDHFTSSSIDAALDAYAKNPRKGMSIVETTKWAAEIVQNDPKLNQSITAMISDINGRSIAAYGIDQYPGNPFFVTSNEFATDRFPKQDSALKETVEKDINEMIKARNTFCGIKPQSP